MRTRALLLLSGLVFAVTLSAEAQIRVNKDSLSLVKQLTDNKAKLLKLQSQVSDRTKEKEETAARAQQSADENRKAANSLSGDPQNSKLAKRADNLASDARSDAKSARKAAERLDDLNKDIRDMTDKIDKEQSRLNRYLIVTPPAPLPKDSAGTITKDSAVPNH